MPLSVPALPSPRAILHGAATCLTDFSFQNFGCVLLKEKKSFILLQKMLARVVLQESP